ncbi:MAG: hypothetical protein HYV40_00125 [Candidatus Levybacteria bacterium]|nr:hypothetical protein [Candidatus Levybacteria bacterium]
MSSRRERRKKLFQHPRPVAPLLHRQVQRGVVDVGRSASGEVRTISPRTRKIAVIAIIVILLLLLLSPKSPTPPALPDGQTLGTQSQKEFKPIELNNIQTTLPPVHVTGEGNLGKTLKDKLQVK